MTARQIVSLGVCAAALIGCAAFEFSPETTRAPATERPSPGATSAAMAGAGADALSQPILFDPIAAANLDAQHPPAGAGLDCALSDAACAAMARAFNASLAAFQAGTDDPFDIAADAAFGVASGIASDTISAAMAEVVPTFELSISAESDQAPTFGALALAPLYETPDAETLLFTQGSVYRRDGRTTANLGLGVRQLTMDDRLLLGVNAFYDHEFPYDHARIGFGGEARSTVAELNVNAYRAVTGWRDAGGLEERALNGFDAEIAAPLPYLPWTRIGGQYYHWGSQSGDTADQGLGLSLEASPLPGLTLEIGGRFSDEADDALIYGLRINLVEAITRWDARPPLIADTPYALASMESRRYDKVRRDNLIRKETRNTTPLVVVVTGF